MHTRHDAHPSENDLRAPCNDVLAQFGPYWKLPLWRTVRAFVASEIPAEAHVLDVGAGPRAFGQRLMALRGDMTYKSMDIDRTTTQDYYSLEEIDEKFDVVLLLEVIEHLSREDAWDMLVSLSELVRPGGKLIVSTPNTRNPSRFLCYVGHITPFPYEWLAAYISKTGLDVSRIVRILGGGLTRRLCASLSYVLWRTLELDPAIQVVVVARKPD